MPKISENTQLFYSDWNSTWKLSGLRTDTGCIKGERYDFLGVRLCLALG